MGKALVPGTKLDIWKEEEELLRPKGLACGSRGFWEGTDMMGFGAPQYPSSSRAYLPTCSSTSQQAPYCKPQDRGRGRGDMCISYVEPRSPRIPSEEQQQIKGLLGPESAGERWKLRVWSESSVMRCRPLRPSLGAHTPSPPSHFVEIPHRFPPTPP